MISIACDSQEPGARKTWNAYRIAGRCVVSNMSTPGLDPYGEATPMGAWFQAPALAQVCEACGTSTYDGQGWIGSRWRRVRVSRADSGYLIDIEGIGTLGVSDDGRAIAAHGGPSASEGELMEGVLGPALVLALALDGVFCLHASAAVRGGRVYAFVGDTGAGKSTLARYLGDECRQGWACAGDDVLPVAIDAGRVVALPHFPQLKLSSSFQPASGKPERLSLGGIVALRGDGQDDVTMQRLTGKQATLEMLRQSVAARLFDQALLAQHLAVCSFAALHVPCWLLRFPRALASLPSMAEALASEIPLEEPGRAGA